MRHVAKVYMLNKRVESITPCVTSLFDLSMFSLGVPEVDLEGS